jgi:class 3 adenylate cyclase
LELRRRLIEHDQTIKELDQARIEVAAEKARAEELLNNLLPAPIAEELKKSGKVQPKYARSATILFADFQGFTLLAERAEPAALVGLLDQYFTAFDGIVARYGLEKLKTIGDAYMAVGGVLGSDRRHPIDACLGAGNAGNGRPYKVAKRENEVAGARVAYWDSYWAGHFRRRRQSPFQLRYLGRRCEHRVLHGSALPARSDQHF